MNFFRKLWNEKPLVFVLIAGAFFRLLAVMFSRGYGMSDDHFVVIEPAKDWLDGTNYNHWLPGSNPGESAPGHSFLYPGLHYILFLFLKFMGIKDPQCMMYVVRGIHALASLVVIYCGFKITAKLSGIRQARSVGLLLAVFWFMPFLSVRNLVEVVCIVPLIYATWLIIKNKSDDSWRNIAIAGVMLALAFSIRYQTALFSVGLGLAMLFKKRFKSAIVLGVFFLLIAASVEGVIDYYAWGKPFAEFAEYVRYNQVNAYGYVVGPWHRYILLLAGILIPPVSIFLLFGFFSQWKKHLYLFLPSFLFLVFHSYFPNKQERFILPVIPFIIVLGYIGWNQFLGKSKFWIRRPKLNAYCWTFFWIINTIPLFVVSFSYSKKSRVEAMTYLAKKPDFNKLIIEDSNHDDIFLPPFFYLGKRDVVFGITKTETAGAFYSGIYNKMPVSDRPNYVLFMQPDNLEKRVSDLKQFLPTLTYEKTIEPSFIDWLLNKMNPHNKNQTGYIYKIK
jgi:hypothetical protein